MIIGDITQQKVDAVVNAANPELTARRVIIAVKLGGGRNAPMRYQRETLGETAKKLRADMMESGGAAGGGCEDICTP